MRVLLVPNTANDRALESARSVSAWLVSHDHEPALVVDDAEACGLQEYGVPRTGVGEPELVVALGGDGTILKAVHILDDVDVPVLGINLGRLGFLSGADASTLPEVIGSVLAGEGRIEHRQTLEATIDVGGRRAGHYRALNEFYVGRGSSNRVVELAIAVNDEQVAQFVCDGVIVATPTGSTAYALSAGGPVVSPDVRALVLVPVAPHTLTARPIVLASDDRVEITCPNPGRSDACVTVDGDVVPCRRALDRVSIWSSAHEVRLVKLDGRDFYRVARTKFLGA